MSIKFGYIAPLLAAGAAAVAIVAAPEAAATPQPACSSASPGTACMSPGNAQINDSIMPDFEDQYPEFSLFGLGGYGGHHR